MIFAPLRIDTVSFLTTLANFFSLVHFVLISGVSIPLILIGISLPIIEGYELIFTLNVSPS